jgi:ankyrin repeat protein
MNYGCMSLVLFVSPIIFSQTQSSSSAVWEELFNGVPGCLLSDDISHIQMQSLVFHWAAQEGKLDLIKTMISHGIDVDVKDKKGQTALFVAARNNHLEIVNLLIQGGADVNLQDINGRTALFIILPDEYDRPCAERIERVVANKLEQQSQWIPTYIPPDDFYDQVVAVLLKAGANPQIKDKDDRTALHWAAVLGRKKVVSLLIEDGAHINEIDRYGGTALGEAAAQGYEDLVHLLTRHGADINIYNRTKGQSPLACASLFGRYTIVTYLVDHGAKLQDDSFALYAAALAGYVDIMELLLKKGANTQIQLFDNSTILHWVASQGDFDMVQLLLKYGAKRHLLDKKGRTPLDIACSYGHSVVVTLLSSVQDDEETEEGFNFSCF